MTKRKSESRESGMRTALAMLLRLDRDGTLCETCDPGDHGESAKMMRNIVWEYLDKQIATGDRDSIEGFCAVITGFLAITCAGCVPDAAYLKSIFGRRLAVESAVANAKVDKPFQQFISAVTTRQ